MTGPQDHPDELREALEKFAGREAERLVDEALAEARDQVRAGLRDVFAKALRSRSTAILSRRLDSAPASDPSSGERPAGSPTWSLEHRVAPSAPAEGTGWYLYAVVDAGDPPDLSGLEGMDPARAPRLMVAAGLAAVVSLVDLAQFDEQEFRAHVDDLEWLASRVRKHEAVVEGLVAGQAVLPMRFGTIYRTEDQVLRLLEGSSAVFRRSLDAVQGRVEWGVKIIRDSATLETWLKNTRTQLRGVRPGPEVGAGTAYMTARMDERTLAEEIDRATSEVVHEVEQVLLERAEKAVTGVSSLMLDGSDVVYDVALLVAEDRSDAFRAAVGELDATHAERGMAFHLTGPWPPYNFVSLDVAAGDGS